MEQKKKPSNAQLIKRLNNALLHVDRTRETVEFYFSDKGMRLIANEDYCIISTTFHSHVFNAITTAGLGKPYLYTRRVIEIALAHKDDCLEGSQYSFEKLMEVLKNNEEEQNEYNILTLYSWWLYNIFHPLYSIGDSNISAFMVNAAYMFNVAADSILLSEKVVDMTNKQFFDKFIETIRDYMSEDVKEMVIFPKKTDEERNKEEIEALQEMENEEIIKENGNGKGGDSDAE